MPKKKKSKTNYTGPIFVTPDGGETVYEQLPNGDRKLVEISQKAMDQSQAYDEADMVGEEAIALRRRYPTLQKAWERYQTVWNLVVNHD